MFKKMLTLSCFAALMAGCADQPSMEQMMQDPGPAPEMAKLEPMLGSWSGTAWMSEETSARMAKMMPEGESMPDTFKGEHTAKWDMDGMWFVQEGWHDMGPDERSHFVERIIWNPKKKKFDTYWFSDRGDRGMGEMTMSADGKSATIKASGVNAWGESTSGEGEWHLVADGEATWSWTERGPMGTMQFEGKATRQ